MIQVNDPEDQRCVSCRHTLLEHEKMGWTCDCTSCPWKEGERKNK